MKQSSKFVKRILEKNDNRKRHPWSGFNFED